MRAGKYQANDLSERAVATTSPDLMEVAGQIEVHDPLLSPEQILQSIRSDPAYQVDLPTLEVDYNEDDTVKILETLLEVARQNTLVYGTLQPTPGIIGTIRHHFRRGARFLFRRHLYQTKAVADSFIPLIEKIMLYMLRQDIVVHRLNIEVKRLQAELDRHLLRHSDN